MQQRITIHQQRRQDNFITIEEPLHISQAIKNCPGAILIECMSMWLNNMLFHQHTEEQILYELNEALALPNDIVFVLNEVGLGVIADTPLVRQYVDLSGRVAQLLAAQCDRVYFCSAGLKIKLKWVGCPASTTLTVSDENCRQLLANGLSKIRQRRAKKTHSVGISPFRSQPQIRLNALLVASQSSNARVVALL